MSYQTVYWIFRGLEYAAVIIGIILGYVVWRDRDEYIRTKSKIVLGVILAVIIVAAIFFGRNLQWVQTVHGPKPAIMPYNQRNYTSQRYYENVRPRRGEAAGPVV